MDIDFITKLIIAVTLSIIGIAAIAYGIQSFSYAVGRNLFLKITGGKYTFFEKAIALINLLISLVIGTGLIFLSIKAFQLWL